MGEIVVVLLCRRFCMSRCSVTGDPGGVCKNAMGLMELRIFVGGRMTSGTRSEWLRRDVATASTKKEFRRDVIATPDWSVSRHEVACRSRRVESKVKIESDICYSNNSVQSWRSQQVPVPLMSYDCDSLDRDFADC